MSNDPSLDYVASHLGPLTNHAPPPEGVLKCPACGTEKEFKEVPYEEQAECINDDCNGQCFCIKWPHWKK